MSNPSCCIHYSSRESISLVISKKSSVPSGHGWNPYDPGKNHVKKKSNTERIHVPASNHRAESPGAETSASLLLQIRDARNQGAWETFTSVYEPLIRGYCTRKGLQHADASDVAQEVMSRVSRAMQSFEYKPERGRFRHWLGTITANEIASHMTRTGRKSIAGQCVEQIPVGDPHWNREFTDHILKVAMDRIRGEFEPVTWSTFEAVWLRKEHSQTVAEAHGIAIHSVYVNKSRVLKRLEAEVMKLAEDLPFIPE
ncbi:MAG: sigma-70 family RNA polymerase sigma factor [Gemmataceae bacterium]